MDSGRRSIRGRSRKKRTGAWMRSVSNGRDLVGAWYMRRTTLEYKRMSVRTASKIVERTKSCRD